MTPTRISLALATALPLALLAGCGSSGPPLTKVTGTVTIDGKPYEGAFVQFVPDASNPQGQEAMDITGASGNYMVRTGGRTGVPPGKYNVMISPAPKTTAAGGMAEGVQEATPENDPGQMEAMMMSSGGPPDAAAKEEVKPTKTFPAEVPDEAEAVLDFDVKT